MLSSAFARKVVRKAAGYTLETLSKKVVFGVPRSQSGPIDEEVAAEATVGQVEKGCALFQLILEISSRGE